MQQRNGRNLDAESERTMQNGLRIGFGTCLGSLMRRMVCPRCGERETTMSWYSFLDYQIEIIRESGV